MCDISCTLGAFELTRYGNSHRFNPLSIKKGLPQYQAIESDRPFRLIEFSRGGAALEVMIYQDGAIECRPLIILHSIEYPLPPSADFCERMSKAGFQVIFIRRPGFGRSTGLPNMLYADDLVSGGATTTTEAALLARLIELLSLKDAVLLAVSSAAPLGYRLAAMTQRVSQVLLSNPRLNRSAWDNSRPGWFIDTLEQVMKNRSGLRLAEKGMKFLIKRDAISFYRQFLKESPGDVRYLEENERDFLVARDLLLQMPLEVLFSETKINVSHDRFLSDGCFMGQSQIVIAGPQSTDSWRRGLSNEAERTGAAFEVAPDGDLFCAYVSPEFIAELVNKHRSS